jgi:hypothetical protein
MNDPTIDIELQPFIEAVENLIPLENREIPKRSKITVIELAIIAQKITSKVLEANALTFQTLAEIEIKEFQSPRFSKQYKKLTGRSIGKGNNKISQVTNILHDAEIIIKEKQLDDACRRLGNIYRLGINNPYVNHLTETMKTYTRNTGETFRAKYIGTNQHGEAYATVWLGKDFYRVEIATEEHTLARFYLMLEDQRSIGAQLLAELHRWDLPIPIGDRISSLIDQTR